MCSLFHLQSLTAPINYFAADDTTQQCFDAGHYGYCTGAGYYRYYLSRSLWLLLMQVTMVKTDAVFYGCWLLLRQTAMISTKLNIFHHYILPVM